MDSIELIDELIEELKGLKYKDRAQLDLIRRRAEMVMRRVFGDDSRYVQDLKEIGFSSRISLSTDKIERKYWSSGEDELYNLFNTMKEEINLFGEMPQEHESEVNPIEPAEYFVDLNRIAELRDITSSEFDLKKLVKLCEELNICYANSCYFAVAMLTRAVIDHIPPVFEFSKFTEVANNYGGGGSSFKKSMRNLQSSSRNIADSYLHLHIRERESLPNKVQVDFRANLDVLLAEIVRHLR